MKRLAAAFLFLAGCNMPPPDQPSRLVCYQESREVYRSEPVTVIFFHDGGVVNLRSCPPDANNANQCQDQRIRLPANWLCEERK